MLGCISVPDQNTDYQTAEWITAEMKEISGRDRLLSKNYTYNMFYEMMILLAIKYANDMEI